MDYKSFTVGINLEHIVNILENEYLIGPECLDVSVKFVNGRLLKHDRASRSISTRPFQFEDEESNPTDIYLNAELKDLILTYCRGVNEHK